MQLLNDSGAMIPLNQFAKSNNEQRLRLLQEKSL